MKTMNASDFKARCLRILDEVAATGEVVVILKRGKEVARLTPPMPGVSVHPQHTLLGTVTMTDDLIEPPLAADGWEAAYGDLEPDP